MSSHPSTSPSGKWFAAFWLFLGWFAQAMPLSAFTAPAEWKFETLQNESSEWWQTLSVQTVPGVAYHLQRSNSLASGSWTTISSTYGSGVEWVCPVFPGTAPTVAPPAGNSPLPSSTAPAHRFAYLILQRTTTGATLVSWSSLDDQTPRRTILSGVTLDPVWDEFDNSYFNEHSNYIFALSPQLHTPVIHSAAAATLGPLDSAMISAFTSAVPTITGNIQNSVAMASQYSGPPQNTGNKAFYRFSADWSLDSDNDGRLDWQELILDGNNPFAADSDGDGEPDQPPDGAGPGGGLPTPTDAATATPLARIEQQKVYFTRRSSTDSDSENTVTGGSQNINAPGWLTEEQRGSLESASTFTAFKEAADDLPLPDDWSGLSNFTSSFNREAGTPDSDGNVTNIEVFSYERSRFRLKLDLPAPPGGYEIPLRVGIVRHSWAPSTGIFLTPHVAEETMHYQIMLRCEEGAMDGIPVDFSGLEQLTVNHGATFVPACLTTRENDTYPEIDGVTRMDAPITGPVLEHGACVKVDARFVADFGNQGFNQIPGIESTPPKVRWQKRKLSGDGTLGEWETMRYPGWEVNYYEGGHVNLASTRPGIFQLQAILVLPNGSEIEFPFVRLRDAKSIKDSLNTENLLQKAGAKDFFGIAYLNSDVIIRNKALSWLGSTQYRFEAEVKINPERLINPSMKGADKCTLFLLHVANSCGATVSYYTRYIDIQYAPLARPDWYSNPERNVDLDRDGWIHAGENANPSPGQVIAGYGTGRSNGHVGVIDYDGTWISAGPKTVNKHINIQNMGPQYRPFAIRGYEP